MLIVYSDELKGIDLSRYCQISFFIFASFVVTSKYILTLRGMIIPYNAFATGGKDHPKAVRYH
jgi:hypothetical protein